MTPTSSAVAALTASMSACSAAAASSTRCWAVAPTTRRLGHLPIALGVNRGLAAFEHVARCHVSNRAVETHFVVLFHELGNDSLAIIQGERRLWTNALALQRPVKSFQLPIALWIERAGADVGHAADANKALEVVGDDAVHAGDGGGGDLLVAGLDAQRRDVVVVEFQLREGGTDIGELAGDEEGGDVHADLVAGRGGAGLEDDIGHALDRLAFGGLGGGLEVGADVGVLGHHAGDALEGLAAALPVGAALAEDGEVEAVEEDGAISIHTRDAFQ